MASTPASASSSANSTPRNSNEKKRKRSSFASSSTTNAAASSSAADRTYEDVRDSFEVYVRKESFKFNAAHFIAYKGFRERLHGHNYACSVRLIGSRIGPDGYVVDFGVVKQIMKRVCKRMNEHFLLPMKSDVLVIDVKDGNVHIACEDGTIFEFPEGDCLKLPIVHSSVEELARYLVTEIIVQVSREYLTKRGIQFIEVSVSEAPGQEAVIRRDIRDANCERVVSSRTSVPPRSCLSNVCGGCPSHAANGDAPSDITHDGADRAEEDRNAKHTLG